MSPIGSAEVFHVTLQRVVASRHPLTDACALTVRLSAVSPNAGTEPPSESRQCSPRMYIYFNLFVSISAGGLPAAPAHAVTINDSVRSVSAAHVLAGRVGITHG